VFYGGVLLIRRLRQADGRGAPPWARHHGPEAGAAVYGAARLSLERPVRSIVMSEPTEGERNRDE
jgi:hypothetical protein